MEGVAAGPVPGAVVDVEGGAEHPASGRPEHAPRGDHVGGRVTGAGPAVESDQTYGALGTVVAEGAIGVECPIREYYLVPLSGPDPDRHRIEICWPAFQTA